MDLFEYYGEKQKEKDSPLALRLRPSSLEEVVGQKHILGEGKLLRRAIQADQLSSLVFYGPPGTGKTTLAQVIAAATRADFRQINATAAGKKDMETVVAEAKQNRAAYGKRTILFIDEIHRFNKAQQDYLLPFVEDGTVILIGATTENPFFEVNQALLSRSHIFELKPLQAEDIATLIRRAVTDPEKGMGMYGARIDEAAVAFLADVAGGDARRALGAVELAVMTTEKGPDGITHITLKVAEECIQLRAIGYDKEGDNHYDVISAFIKSMRGSDPDAALYYLARMIEAGEDPRFIARRIIQADQLASLIFYGPPGTGKTTLAQVIAHATKAHFRQINATAAGKKDMEEVVKEAQETRAAYGKKTILFIDEIHRFNKAQQDYLLPFVEDGTVILIGATTENPFFEVNRALISRSQLFQLKPLEQGDIAALIRRAVSDAEKGMGMYQAVIEEAAVRFLADVAGGDARRALGAVELAVLTTERGQDGLIHITLPVAEECIQRRAVGYDKSGDNHYDVISAFIKSMRGSDPDAALYYLARMILAGEDPKFIVRRIMICAAEDVGLADPRAMQVAVAASEVLERVGMPEGRIPLALAATYVATAPKSNAAYLGIDKALEAVAHTDIK